MSSLPLVLTSFPSVTSAPPQFTVASGTVPLVVTSLTPVESQISTVASSPTPSSTGGGGNSGNVLANSASLYLYTFLSTLVLLFCVSGAIVVRSFILRQRRRRMVEEARWHGVPPTPPVTGRPALVDLSKKPELWEAYLEGGGGSGGGWQLGSFGDGNGKELDMGTSWKLDSHYSRDWESIKPIYAEPLISPPYSGSTPNLTSLSPAVSFPVPTPANPSLPRGDGEDNRRTAEISTGTTTPSLLTRARRIFLNPTSASSSADNGSNPGSIPTNISPSSTELSSDLLPPAVRVAVLIAMPSPSSHGSSTPLSASLSSSLSSKAQPTTSHPLQLSPSTTLRVTDDDERQFPRLEMGVADVVIVRSLVEGVVIMLDLQVVGRERCY